MFGLLFLVVIPLMFFGYVYFVSKVFAKTHVLVRIGAVGLAAFLPIGYFFLWQYSDGYKQFQQLCASPDRVKVYKTVPVASAHSEYGSEAVDLLRSGRYVSVVFQGTEFRRGPKFNEAACENKLNLHDRKPARACTTVTKDDVSEVVCGDEQNPDGSTSNSECFTASKDLERVDYVAVKTRYGGEDKSGGFGSLLQMSLTQYQSEVHGVLAEVRSYTFYKYGTGWATILGAASGSAPSISCKERAKFDIQQITPPKP
jgi:hypothetical protein